MSDIIERINSACVGHPHAKIPWPHRVLHDARAEIERLRDLLGRFDRHFIECEGTDYLDRVGEYSKAITKQEAAEIRGYLQIDNGQEYADSREDLTNALWNLPLPPSCPPSYRPETPRNRGNKTKPYGKESIEI